MDMVGRKRVFYLIGLISLSLLFVVPAKAHEADSPKNYPDAIHIDREDIRSNIHSMFLTIRSGIFSDSLLFINKKKIILRILPRVYNGI